MAASSSISKMNFGKDVDANLVQKHMTKILQNFNSLRGVKVDANKFYDVVVITASDERQANSFQKQMDNKLLRGELPLGAHYLVYADPPVYKAGSGQSILQSLSCLRERFGAKLSDYRVLIICAGGWSQRLSFASVLGKLFLHLPITVDGKPYQMIDLKLALYLPFLERMKPGFLVTCSDDIETYLLPDEPWSSAVRIWSFDHDGFVALGHISNLDIATKHGVYILPSEACSKAEEFGVSVSGCRTVLQKPSMKIMEETGATLFDDWACTDSIFSFDGRVASVLLDTYEKVSPVTYEIEAYGHFLPVLRKETLNEFEETLRDSLKGTPVTVVLLRHSTFYHLGTMPEYMDNVTNSSSGLGKELSFQPWTFSRYSDSERTDHVKDAIVMHSVIHPGTSFGSGCVVEYSEILFPISIGTRSLVSHCRVSGTDPDMEKIAVVPEGCFVHTVSVAVDGYVKYVTVAFGVNDNVYETDRNKLRWLDRLLGERMLEILRCSSEERGAKEPSLWNLKMFPIEETMEDSFRRTLRFVHRFIEEDYGRLDPEVTRMSMADILRCKDAMDMLGFRDKLYNDLKSG